MTNEARHQRGIQLHVNILHDSGHNEPELVSEDSTQLPSINLHHDHLDWQNNPRDIPYIKPDVHLVRESETKYESC